MAKIALNKNKKFFENLMFYRNLKEDDQKRIEKTRNYFNEFQEEIDINYQFSEEHYTLVEYIAMFYPDLLEDILAKKGKSLKYENQLNENLLQIVLSWCSDLLPNYSFNSQNKVVIHIYSEAFILEKVFPVLPKDKIIIEEYIDRIVSAPIIRAASRKNHSIFIMNFFFKKKNEFMLVSFFFFFEIIDVFFLKKSD